MKFRALALALFLPALSGHAAFTNNQTAVSVLGQPDFTSITAPGNATAASIENPEGTVVDPVTGKLFIADSSSNRVLRFSSANAYATGASAEAVLGQGNFTSTIAYGGSQTPTATGMYYPVNLYLDKAGRLWVPEYYGGRVLRFDKAATKATGAAADGVLGKPDFTSSNPNAAPTAGNIFQATGVTGDSAGRIWVSDTAKNRVLRFDNAAAKANGANADAVLGQGNFTTATAATSASGMRGPYGLSLDSAGRLWVGDADNNRVLRFDSAATKANGASADAVLGQANLASLVVASATASNLNKPYYVTAATNGTLWVSDYSNARILAYTNAATKANGADADLVIGQPDFVTSTKNPSANGFNNPTQIAFAGPDTFFVGDYDANRVLRFGPTVYTPATLTAPKTATARRGTVTIKGTSTNATVITYRVGTKGAFKSAAGTTANWTIKLTRLAPGKTYKVTILATAPGAGTKQAIVTVKSL